MFEDRIPFDRGVALRWLLPMYAVTYVQAVLVQLPRTRTLRLALLPIGLYIMYTCAHIDYTAHLDAELRQRILFLNLQAATNTFAVAMVFICFAVAIRPYRPIDRQKDAMAEEPRSSYRTLINAVDLCTNARGIGWDWDVTPRHTEGRWQMIKKSAISFLIHTMLVDPTIIIMHALNPALKDPLGASMYMPAADGLLSSIIAHISPAVITICMGLNIYAASVYGYDFIRILALLAGDDPARWPPLFDEPWTATSLHELWAERWHQWFRHSFSVLGATPARAVGNRLGGRTVGRLAGLLGGFAVSVILHTVGLWGLGRGGDPYRVGVFFMMMAVGMIVEELYRMVTGRRVSGLVGWLWTWVWIIGWGQFLVEAYARKGLIGQQWLRLWTHLLQGLGWL
ncbi:hypothetical protein EV122DRAFT_217159 [Schizophyllum commune]